MAHNSQDFLFVEHGKLRLAARGRPAVIVAYIAAILVAAILGTALLPLVGRLLWLVMDFP